MPRLIPYSLPMHLAQRNAKVSDCYLAPQCVFMPPGGDCIAQIASDEKVVSINVATIAKDKG
jgi:hypothetical protein